MPAPVRAASAERAQGHTDPANADPAYTDPENPDPESTARLIALRLLDAQPRTRVELERALARRGVPTDAATAVLDRFAEVGLIDDEAFAQAWVTSRHAGRGLGRRALTVELQRRGVDAETIGEAVSAVSAEDEEVAARALVSRRLRTVSGLPRETARRRLVGMLARRGFSQALAARVVDASLSDQAMGPVPGDWAPDDPAISR